TTRHRQPLLQPGDRAADGSIVPDIADARACLLEEGRRFPTKVAGLFLFFPLLLELDLPRAVIEAGLPGSEQVPPLQAVLALFVPQLLGQRRGPPNTALFCAEGGRPFSPPTTLPQGPPPTPHPPTRPSGP